MPGPYASSNQNSYLGIFKEAVKGTGGAPTVFAAYLPSVDLDHGQEINPIREAGTQGQVTIDEKIAHMPGGKFTFLARPSLTARIYAYLLGQDTISGAAPTTHTEIDDLVTDYLSIEQNLADEGIERFIDCAIAEITFRVSTQDTQICRVDASWIGGAPSWIASPTAESYETDNPFVFGDGAFTIDGSVVTNLISAEVKVTMGFARQRVADVVATYLIKLTEDVEVTISQLMLDPSTEYRKVQYGTITGTTYLKTPTPGSFVADFNYGSGAGLREAKLEVLNMDYLTAQYSPLNPDGEVVMVTRTARGKKAGGNPLFRYTGKNSDSAAYV